MRIKAQYVDRVKRLLNRLKRESSKDLNVPPREPVDQMLLAILHRGNTLSRAESALAHLLDHVVDHNDLRVTPTREMIDYLDKRLFDPQQKAEAIRQALNGTFDKLNNLDLAPLREKSKKDARDFLESIPGLDPYAVANVLLLALGHSVFPVSDHVFSVLQEEKVLPDDVDVATVQTWLERQLAAGDAVAFYVLLEGYAAEKAPRWVAAPVVVPPVAPPEPEKTKEKEKEKEKAAAPSPAKPSGAKPSKKAVAKKGAPKKPSPRKTRRSPSKSAAAN
jgi:endonuclease III